MLSHIVSDLHEHYVKEILEPQIGKDKTKAKPNSPSDLDNNGDVDSFEKKVRQFIYDVRHIVRKKNVPVKKAFEMRSSQTNYGQKVIDAVKQKLKIESGGGTPVSEENGHEEKLFSVLIRYKNGTSYRKRTSRTEIQRLRSNPNVSSVEMTRYGVDGAAKKDYDGDGKVESGSKEHAGAVHNAIQRKKGGVPDGQDTRGKSKKEKKSHGLDEKFSNWRHELIEVSNQNSDETPQKIGDTKNIKNKVIINPDLKIESVIENLGGKIIDIVEEELVEDNQVVDIFEDVTNAEFYFCTNDLIEEVVTEFFMESLDEGYDIDFITESILQSLDNSIDVLNEEILMELNPYAPAGSDESQNYNKATTKSKRSAEKAVKRAEKIKKIKDTVKKVGSSIKSGIKKAGKTVAGGVGYAAGKAVSAAKKVGSEVKSGYEKGSSSNSQSTTTRRSKGSSRPSDDKKPGLRSYLKSSIKKGFKKAIGKAARSVSRGARNVARSIGEQTEINEKITAKTDVGTAIKDFYSSSSPQLSGRTKEEKRKAAIAAVLTARRGGKKLGEAIVDQPTPADDTVRKTQKSSIDKQQLQNMKMIQQKKMMLDRQKLQMQKAGKLPLENSYEPEGDLVDEATAAAKRGLPEPHRSETLKASGKREAGKLMKTPQGKRELKRRSDYRRQNQTPESQAMKRERDAESARVNSANRRTAKYGLTKKQRALSDAIRKSGPLGS
jgi:hypothetical protein